ncbi:hypothetical protein BBJ28_00002949 [Nothophytophthora sp. Chile5]|nr:hypothetical protein BBJ28_00002949 [Nothophytophthora sp. Chile5]
MLTESASPLVTSGARRADARKKRRDAAAPYAKREKTSGDDEDEDATSVEFYDREPAHVRRGSLFSRLVSYIPLVGKLVAEEEDEEEDEEDVVDEVESEMDGAYDAVDPQSSDLPSTLDEEEEVEETEDVETNDSSEQVVDASEAEEVTPSSTNVDEDMDEPASPVTRAAPSFAQIREEEEEPQAKEQVPTSNGRSKKDTSPGFKSRTKRSPSREQSVERGELSPAQLRPQRKRNEQRAFLPGPSQTSKMLRISTTQRRRKSSSPAPTESALAVIKQKKTISFDEYERLAHQLRDLVEPTPHAALAMTQNALADGLERQRWGSPAVSMPSYVPGSIASQTNGALVVQEDSNRPGMERASVSGVPFGKRFRTHDNRPVFFSGNALRGHLTREERLERKPRPSRLLTGVKRDAAARSAYSAAVAEKILSTLNKVQNPLEREARKPTPSTSLSWAKYHLALVEDQKTIENGREETNEVPPPTATVPRVAFPQPPQKPAQDVSPPTPFATFTTLPKSALKTPNTKSMAFAVASGGVTPLFSPQAVSMTPAIEGTTRAAAAKTSAAVVTEQLKAQTIGQFTFTLPLQSERAQKTGAEDEDGRVQFAFSPPPAMREPPMKVPSQKTASKGKGGAAPFDFVPTSPKMRMEWLSKAPTPKEPEKQKPALKNPTVPKETEKASAKPAAPAATLANGAVNPLARFMQLKPGQWKCPGCSVLNEATSAKCPCCETAQPGGAAPAKAAAVAAPKPAGTITSSGFSFGAPMAETKKDAEKPTAAITSSGFSFGAPMSETKTDAEKPAPAITSSGFSFGAPATSAESKDAEKPAPSGFSFAIPTSTVPDTKTDAASNGASISFGFTAPAKADAAATSKPSLPTGGFSFGAPAASDKETAKVASPPSFSFGVPKATAQTSVATSEPAALGGFSFGATSTVESTSKGKRKAPEVEASLKESTPAFSFGGATTTTTGPSMSSPATGFSFGASPEPAQSSREESDRPKKRSAPSFAKSDSGKPESTTAAFSFGATSTPPQIPAKDTFALSSGFSAGSSSTTPSFSFGGTASASTAEKPKEAAPSFSFGGSSEPAKPAVSFGAPAETTPPKSGGFTFGSSSTASSTPATKPTSGFGQDAGGKPPAFGFGAPKSSSPPTAPSAATPSTGFSFGQTATKPAAAAAAFGAGSASSPAAFGFGASTSTPSPNSNASTPPTASATPAVTATPFGSTSAAQPSTSSGFGSSSGVSTFGQAPASTTSGFGSSTTAFGSGPSTGFGSGASTGGFGSTSAAAPSTAFGASAASTSASPSPPFAFGATSQAPAMSAPVPAASQPAFAFGASAGVSTGFGAASATSVGFGAPPATSTGFGSSAVTTGFSAPPAFGASAPAPAFGGQTAPAFGASLPAPTTTFGAPSFGAPASGGFGSGPPSTGFRTPSPTPGAFGAAPVPAFGAPSTGFGASAAAPAPGGFGAPSAGAFGAPADGGFNMGAAPQHIKGRRILKARSEPLGLNHAIRRDKKNTALSKHKKWLYDLQKERTRLQAALAEDEAVDQQRRERFSQREAKQREAVRNNNNGDAPEDEAGPADKKKVLSRPMWALTKATAEEKLESLEDAEANDLIAFANNLDIDQFMDDVEIKARVAQVEQQLAQVQSIVDYEEAEEKRCEREQQRLEDIANGGGALNGNDLDRLGWDRAGAKDGDDDDAMSVASSVLSECKSIRSVHSVRSVAAITKRVEAKLLTDGSGASAPSEAGSTPYAPRVVTIDEEQGIRMQIKTLPSNLPYIHRNPAI